MLQTIYRADKKLSISPNKSIKRRVIKKNIQVRIRSRL